MKIGGFPGPERLLISRRNQAQDAKRCQHRSVSWPSLSLLLSYMWACSRQGSFFVQTGRGYWALGSGKVGPGRDRTNPLWQRPLALPETVHRPGGGMGQGSALPGEAGEAGE